jgi:hypothetical protein
MLCPATTNEIHSLSGSRNGGSTCRSFYSGVFETANVSYQGSGSGGNYLFSDESWYIAQAKIYCVRIYNRVLTDSEILHNYDVDKKIFKSL